MILPIYLYGSSILRQRTRAVKTDAPELQRLIDDMIDTMHAASGIGLAAPQVGRTERLFVVDLSPLADDFIEEMGSVPAYAREPLVFLNSEILEHEEASIEAFEEGCLSIPEIRERVERPDAVRVRYLDRHFQPHEIEATGMFARVLQHEHDHVEGVLFVDHLSALRRRMLQRRLRAISQGEVEADYQVTLEDA